MTKVFRDLMNGLGEIDNFLAEKKADTKSRLRERSFSELRKRWRKQSPTISTGSIRTWFLTGWRPNMLTWPKQTSSNGSQGSANRLAEG